MKKRNNPDKNIQAVEVQETFALKNAALNARVFLASSYCRGTDEKYLYAFGCDY